jgi:iron uptake system component EfeO
MRKSITCSSSVRRALRVAMSFGILLVLALAAARPVAAASMAEGAKQFKPFIVERIGKAVAGARKMQAAIKASDAKAAREAWIESRRAWEGMEPVTAEYFGDLDKLIDAWPDAKQGYHAIEAALFAGKLDGLDEAAEQLIANLDKFERRVGAKGFNFAPQRLLSGIANLAYEVGEEKSKGGESPYAGTSLLDMQENVEGIAIVYRLVFADTLRKRDAKLADIIRDRIDKLEGLVKVKDIKSLDAKAVHVTGEELAVLLQSAAPKLGLKTFKVGDEDENK